jgi:hypothetical protein
MNAVIKTGLLKGVTTQNLMVSFAFPPPRFAYTLTFDIRIGTMGLLTTRRRYLHQFRASRSAHCRRKFLAFCIVKVRN